MKETKALSSRLTVLANNNSLLSVLLVSSLVVVPFINIAHADGEDLSKYKNILANNLPSRDAVNSNSAQADSTQKKPIKPAEKKPEATPKPKADNPIEPKKNQAVPPPNKRITLQPGEATIIVPTVDRLVVEEVPEPTFTELTQAPNESNLSSANRTLLAKNALLERSVNDLETQVNVLVNERSGQLFMYGVYTALASFFGGGFISYLIFGRRRNNW